MEVVSDAISQLCRREMSRADFPDKLRLRQIVQPRGNTIATLTGRMKTIWFMSGESLENQLEMGLTQPEPFM